MDSAEVFGGPRWEPVSRGESGAQVLYDADGERFAKVVPHGQTAELAAERDRIAWLATTGIPGPTVLGWSEGPGGTVLVTKAVPGVPADQLDAEALLAAWPAIAATLKRLHAVPVETSPFSRGLDEMLTLARATVAEDRVHTEFLPEALQSVPPGEILAGLDAEVPVRREQEASDRVVCHGDFCLPNILIDPVTSQVTGLIDLGRLGTADPYADIALLLANARETWPDETTAQHADQLFAEHYGISLDPARQGFYLRLDPLTW